LSEDEAVRKKQWRGREGERERGREGEREREERSRTVYSRQT
jgi:hypothetical protein